MFGSSSSSSSPPHSSMSSRMFVRLEFLRPRDILFVNLVMGTILIILIIAGSLGPLTYISSSTYSFNCGAEGDHLGIPCPPYGVNMSQPNSTVVLRNLDYPVNELNQFFGLALAPYSTQEGYFVFPYEIAVYGYDGANFTTVINFKDSQEFACVVCEHLPRTTPWAPPPVTPVTLEYP